MFWTHFTLKIRLLFLIALPFFIAYGHLLCQDELVSHLYPLCLQNALPLHCASIQILVLLEELRYSKKFRTFEMRLK